MSDDADATTVSDPGDLIDGVAEYDEDLAAELETVLVDREDRIADLEETVGALREETDELAAELESKDEEIDDLTSRLKRKQADFQNYKKRQEREQERIKQQATERLIERFLDVRDNLTRALDEEASDIDQLKEGLRMTLESFDSILDAEGVSAIDPAPGDPVDPHRHEVMMRTAADQPADTIAGVHRVGYELEDSVIRPAQVTVSTGPEDQSAQAEE